MSLSTSALRGARLWGAFLVLALVATAAVAQTTITFDDFSDVSDLTLNSDAETLPFGGQDVLRLTDTATSFQAGSAFLTDAISLADQASFSTAFSFQITDPSGISDIDGVGADGIVFVVQTVANNVGGAGSGIGYQGIANSLGVEFDTFNNGSQDGSNGNHIGVNLNGSPSSVARINVADRMNDGDVLYAWVDYDGSAEMLEIRFSTTDVRPASPILTYSVDLATVLGQTDAFVGFTSATGSAFNNHDIRSWTFVNTFAPVGVNQPPVPVGIADGDVIDVTVDMTKTIAFSFTSPEAGQITTIEVTDVGTNEFVDFFATTTPGNPATGEIEFSVFNGTGGAATGIYELEIEACDDATDGAGNDISECTTLRITVDVDYPPTKACDFDVQFYINEFQARPGSNYVQLYSTESGLVDLTGCSFVAFDAFSEEVVVTLPLTFTLFPFAEPNLIAGEDFSGEILSGPGAIAIVKGTPALGDDVTTVLGDVVNAIVYRTDEDIFGLCGAGPLIGGLGGDSVSPCNSDAGRTALAEALARLGMAVAAEDETDLDLSVVAAPNPVTRTGTVSFGLATAGDAHVVLFDALGRQVATLAEGPHSIGRHEVRLDVSGLPTGIYVIRAVAGGEVQTTRVTVVR